MLTRLGVLLAGVAAVTVIGTDPPPHGIALWRVSANELENMLARWDTGYYFSIATAGYQWDPATFSHQNVAYFPLLPLLMRWGGALLGGRPLLAGAIISVAAFGGAMAVLYRLALLEMDDARARSALLLMTTYPYAFYYSIAYTEALFLLVTAGAFYAMRRRILGAVVVCGIAAGLCRPNGFWLACPLVLLAFTHHRQRPLAFLAACAPLLGVAAFSGYLFLRFDDALAWAHGQAAWGMPLFGRPSAPDLIRLPGEPLIKPTEVAVWIGNGAAWIVGIAAILPVWRRFGAAHAAWLVLNLFPPVLTHLLQSTGRYTAVLFPVFFWLALRLPGSRVAAVAAVFTLGQLVLAVWFFLWYPVV